MEPKTPLVKSQPATGSTKSLKREVNQTSGGDGESQSKKRIVEQTTVHDDEVMETRSCFVFAPFSQALIATLKLI